MSDVRTLATLSDGVKIALSDGMLYPLTACCGGSGKGSEVPSGVVCRACYTEVDTDMGDAWMFRADTAENDAHNGAEKRRLTAWIERNGGGILSPTIAFTIMLEATPKA